MTTRYLGLFLCVVLGATLLPLSTASANTNFRDLEVSAEGPALTGIGDRERLTFTIANLGDKKARNVELIVLLPIEGAPFSFPNRCSVQNFVMTCNMGNIKAGASKRVRMRFDFPLATGAFVFDASATTTSTDVDLSNNSASLLMQTTEAPPFLLGDGDVMSISVCYGSTVLSFGDCLANPGSILQGQIGFNSDNTITTFDPGYYGDWEQINGYTIRIYVYLAADDTLVTTWDGVASGPDCYDGTNVNPTATFYGGWRGCLSGFP